MPEPTFESLRDELLDRGLAPRHVYRIVEELNDHLDDLYEEALSRGMPAVEAQSLARRQIGDPKEIARRLLDRPELRTWCRRHPRVARVYLPLAYALLLPVSPVFAGIANAGIVIRWGAALMLSAGITAAMFLSMQLAIALT